MALLGRRQRLADRDHRRDDACMAPAVEETLQLSARVVRPAARADGQPCQAESTQLSCFSGQPPPQRGSLPPSSLSRSLYRERRHPKAALESLWRSLASDLAPQVGLSEARS